jgi:hypothetical protein
VLGGAAHAAWPLIFPGVVARRGDIETMTRRGRFTRARLPMRIVHNFRHGTSDAILPSRGADRARGGRHHCGLGGIPGCIRSPTTDCGVGFGWLGQPFGISELSLEEMNPHLIFMPVVAQMLDLLLEEPIFLIGGGLTISARWWPGLKGVSLPTTRSAGLTGVPEGRGASAPL